MVDLPDFSEIQNPKNFEKTTRIELSSVLTVDVQSGNSVYTSVENNRN
jgi:hypothetical protein